MEVPKGHLRLFKQFSPYLLIRAYVTLNKDLQIS